MRGSLVFFLCHYRWSSLHQQSLDDDSFLHLLVGLYLLETWCVVLDCGSVTGFRRSHVELASEESGIFEVLLQDPFTFYWRHDRRQRILFYSLVEGCLGLYCQVLQAPLSLHLLS